MYIHSTPLHHNPVLKLDDPLENFLSCLNLSASIKDTKTGQYTAANETDAKLYGLKPAEQIGLTVYDIAHIAKLPTSVVEQLLKLDQAIATQTWPNAHLKLHFLAKSGFITINEAFKKPIFSNGNNKVSAILSYAHNITTYCNPTYLLFLYEKYYLTKVAIEKFLQYLKIDTFFYKFPTKRELMSLLAMRENPSAKYVAHKLKTSTRTVEEYKARLRIKLKVISLDEVLVSLSKRHEYETINA